MSGDYGWASTGGYREPAEPAPKLFRLRPPVVGGTWTVAVALLVLLAMTLALTGVGFFLCVLPGVALSAVGYLASGAPRALEVGRGGVAVHYWFRRRWWIPAGDLQVQRLPGELVVVDAGQDRSVGLPESAFVGERAEAAADALAELLAATN